MNIFNMNEVENFVKETKESLPDYVHKTWISMFNTMWENIEANPTKWSLFLTRPSMDKKLNTIKLVRQITKLGLKEAKDLVDHFELPRQHADSLRHFKSDMQIPLITSSDLSLLENWRRDFRDIGATAIIEPVK